MDSLKLQSRLGLTYPAAPIDTIVGVYIYICMKTVTYFTQFADPIRLSGYFKLDMRYGVKWVVKHVTSHVEAAFAEMD